MNQAPKKKKEWKLPEKALEDGHDLMECIFGKRIMKEVDKIVEDRSKDAEVYDESAMP